MYFYYFWFSFLPACILFDLYSGTVSGFTAGYAASLAYMIVRYREFKKMTERKK